MALFALIVCPFMGASSVLIVGRDNNRPRPPLSRRLHVIIYLGEHNACCQRPLRDARATQGHSLVWAYLIRQAVTCDSVTLMSVVQFAPFASLVDPAFWHALSQQKIDVLKLSQQAVPLHASYSLPRSFYDRTNQQEVAISGTVNLGGHAFDVASPRTHPTLSSRIRGTLVNFNTIEEFKSSDKAAIFNDLADNVLLSFAMPSPLSSVHPIRLLRCGMRTIRIRHPSFCCSHLPI
jgi:hypothetical protein